jgi:hypothetical protein
VPVIGFLNAESTKAYSDQVAAFHQGLREADYIAACALKVEYRGADGHNDRPWT